MSNAIRSTCLGLLPRAAAGLTGFALFDADLPRDDDDEGEEEDDDEDDDEMHIIFNLLPRVLSLLSLCASSAPAHNNFSLNHFFLDKNET